MTDEYKNVQSDLLFCSVWVLRRKLAKMKVKMDILPQSFS